MGDGNAKSGKWRGLKKFSETLQVNYKTLKYVIYKRSWPTERVHWIWKMLRETPYVTRNGMPFAEQMPKRYEMRKEMMAYAWVPEIAEMTGRSQGFVDGVMRHKVWVTEKSKVVWQVATGIYGKEIMEREGTRFCREYAEWK